ncbi:hypothetical protein [Kineococcus sp. G2]|uniref:hypothetical protein n=1 Tax=Kineococcus sp. G2 TaxID=3127484 RepID=UPI00301C958C
MPKYRVNREALEQAHRMIDAGEHDDSTSWSDAAPSTSEGNEVRDEDGWDAYASWHLAEDPDASERTKKRYHFPYGDFTKVNRSAVVHAEQRASQNDHPEIEKAADELLQHLDRVRS